MNVHIARTGRGKERFDVKIVGPPSKAEMMDALSHVHSCVSHCYPSCPALLPHREDEKTAKCSEVIRLDMALYT